MKSLVVRVLAAGALAAPAASAVMAQPAPAERAQPNIDPARYFSPPDHPENARGVSGATSVRLTVGANGRVTGCAVRRSSGSASLDSATCRILVSRARFRPARDSAGVPMEDRFDLMISWPPTGMGMVSNSSPPPAVVHGGGPPIPSVIDARNPQDRPARRATARAALQAYVAADDYPPAARAAGAEGTVAFALIVGADGRVTNCRITRSSGSAQLDQATCRILRSRARFTPAVSRSGQPMDDFLESHISWTLPRR